jgi:hypothetical protein
MYGTFKPSGGKPVMAFLKGKMLSLICASALLAIGVSLLVHPVPVEQRLIQIQANNVLNGLPGVENEPIEIKAILLDFSDDPVLLLKAQAALISYPVMTRRVLKLYGTEPEFRGILKRYGDNVIPPIHYFMIHQVSTIELMNKGAERYEALKRFFSGTPEDSRPAPDSSPRYRGLSMEERGWYAVNFIRGEGHDFIGQFIVDAHGKTQWVATERVLEGLNQFFASGIRNLETQYRTDGELTASDIGWASVDILVFASAVKLLRAGRAAAASTKGASRATRSAVLAARINQGGRMILKSARYAKWPAIIAGGYLVITNPSLISDLLSGIAEVLGLPEVAVQFTGWFLLLLPLLYLGSWLFRLLASFVTGLALSAQFALNRLARKR